ncbi:MAG: hypothetical protein J6Y11_13900 [Paludibacteraceae bacterium]|nr:hypothetical protein [Paludibacteraceae bacterium]
MGVFSRIFGLSNEDSSNAHPTMADSMPETTVPQPTMADSTLEENADASASAYTPGVIKVNLQTGRPIDAIYLYIKQDNTELGYNDAIRLHNIDAMDEGVTRIKNGLKTLLDQVNMKYQDRVLKQETIVKTCKRLCYSDSESEAQSILDQLNSHIKKVEQLRKDLEEGADNVRNMTDTYEKGFKQGMLDIMGGGIHAVAPTSASSDIAIIEG